MSTPDLYQVCDHCHTLPRLADGKCPSCNNLRFFKVGLTLGQVDGLVERSKRFYLPDGSHETLLSERHVIERRKQAAVEMEQLRAEVARLRTALANVQKLAEHDLEHGCPSPRSLTRQIEAEARAALEGKPC